MGFSPFSPLQTASLEVKALLVSGIGKPSTVRLSGQEEIQFMSIASRFLGKGISGKHVGPVYSSDPVVRDNDASLVLGV